MLLQLRVTRSSRRTVPIRQEVAHHLRQLLGHSKMLSEAIHRRTEQAQGRDGGVKRTVLAASKESLTEFAQPSTSEAARDIVLSKSSSDPPNETTLLAPDEGCWSSRVKSTGDSSH